MKKPTIRTQLEESEVIKDFELLDIYSLNAYRILESNIPEEVIKELCNDEASMERSSWAYGSRSSTHYQT